MIVELSFEEGKKAFENREQIDSSFKEEVKEVMGFNRLTPEVVDNIFNHLHVHDNFLCGAANYVQFRGHILKKVFKKDNLYFMVGDKNNPYRDIFFKIENK